MFADLRQQIQRLTAVRKRPASDTVSRTFFLLASPSLFHLKDWFLQAVDRDTDAFNQVLTAMRMPKTTDVDITARAYWGTRRVRQDSR